LYVSNFNFVHCFLCGRPVLGFVSTVLKSRAISRVNVELKTKISEISFVYMIRVELFFNAALTRSVAEKILDHLFALKVFLVWLSLIVRYLLL
jgi:hypothetical protein